MNRCEMKQGNNKVRIHIHIDHIRVNKVTWVIKISQQCLYDVKLMKNRYYTLISVIRPRNEK